MLYIVECSYADPESEASWNTFYSQHKLPALVSVGGFRASQRFRALSSRSPLYLAIHTITDAAVIASEEYRLKGGGNFSRWQAHICDWRRNLYRYDDVFPQVSQDEVLLLSPAPLDFIDAELGYPPTILHAAGLDNNPPQRVAYILPRREARLLAGQEKYRIYETMGAQLLSSLDNQPDAR
ncbi:TPA: sugar ABC transporter [Klebsiella oxytoca]|uniref:Sugar ABC transporter n=1 Tax=Klebsiella oxytoca TaxID=571 RepID=A0AAN5L9K3_KLEOX|nr:sugar ABC transporter [Klebsiella oxytoca]MDM4091566.1 sugar ABC transporter [Klebsiella oxytoca]HAT1682855.1 sugar ABC transporter [Klebsiella oxytoca]